MLSIAVRTIYHILFLHCAFADKGKIGSLRGGHRELKPACPQSTPKNWQKWAQLDYEVTSPCGPEGDHACFGNGVCECNVCVCDIGWRGPYCSQLDLLPAKKDAHGIPMDGNHPTWGGSAVFENGKWSFLVGSKISYPATSLDPKTYWDRSPAYDATAVENGGDAFGGENPWEYTVDPLKDPFPNGDNRIDSSRDIYEQKSWLTLYESEGSDAAGPYHKKVSKWYKAFRADLKKDPVTKALLELSNANGGFTVIQSASASIDGPWTDNYYNPIDSTLTGASPGVEPRDTTPMPEPVYKFSDNGHCVKGWDSLGEHLAGKYVTRDNGQYRECTAEEKNAWNCHLADPAIVLYPNGTSVIAYRGTRCESIDGEPDKTERIGLLVAESWRGPYEKETVPILGDDEVMDGGLEDLFMWHDSRGTHMIVHSQAIDHAYDLSLDRAGFHHKKKRGAYLFSADGRKRWSLSDWELFPSEIQWNDGTTEFLLKQQRPSLVFDPNTGRPSHLVTGVDFLFDPCCDWYGYGSAWTLVQPISSCPAGQVQSNDDSSCTTCLTNDNRYQGRCREATSKYGSCVCAVCKNGYSGDECESKPTELPTLDPTLQPTQNPTEFTCTPCNDVGTPSMIRKGKDCATSKWIVKWCSDHPKWVKNNYCQLSCYNQGKGYEGDVCCNSS